MKKVLSVLLAIAFVVGLVGCDLAKIGNDTTASDVAEVVKKEYVKIINSEKYDVTEKDPYVYQNLGLKTITKTYTLKEKVEIQLPASIKVADTDVTLSTTTVNDILNSGWAVVAGKTADQLQKAGMVTNTSVKNQSGDIATFYAFNNTGSDVAFGECVIQTIRIKYEKGGMVNDTANFSINEKISKASTYADIVEAFGEPASMTVNEYYRDDEYAYHTFEISYTYSGKTMKFSFSNEADVNNEKMTEMRIDY